MVRQACALCLLLGGLSFVACTNSTAPTPATPTATPVAKVAKTATNALPEMEPVMEATNAPAKATPSAQPGTEQWVTLPSGLKYADVVVGTGARPMFGQRLLVIYTGRLDDGTKFDSNEGKQPIDVRLGNGEVVKGWEIGIGGGKGIEPMRIGGKRKLVIPPALGYGSDPMGTIPPNSTLSFDVELVGVR